MRRHTIRILAVISAAALTTTLMGTDSSAQVCWKYRAKERRMIKKINGARASRGIVRLQKDPQLSRVARRHSRHMAERRNVKHTRNLGRLVTKWSMLAENVGGRAKNVRQMHRAFMKSSGHRYNLLDSSYAHVGVGIIRAGGKIWVTEVFEAVANPGTTLEMPTC